MRRPAVVTAIAFGVVVFLAISLLLARGLSGAGAERAKTLDVLHAEARGDADAVLALLPACRRVPACATSTRSRVQRLRAPGKVEILAFDPSARVSLGGGVGSALVAWRAGAQLP